MGDHNDLFATIDRKAKLYERKMEMPGTRRPIIDRFLANRPLAMTVVVSGVALACSPVSAAMAAMITLTDVEPYNFDLVKILSIAIPAAIVGIFAISRKLATMRWCGSAMSVES
mgnify:CR=1 FL=1